MFQPLSLFVGLRYVRARQHTFFVSFITWVSLGGVALGVAALIVVLSVMNGLKSELRDRLLTLTAHARVVDSRPAAQVDDTALAARLGALPGVLGVAPYMDLQALAMHGSDMVPVTLRGIDPRREAAVTRLEPLLLSGSLAALRAGDNHLILGEALAQQLGVAVGETIRLLVPIATADAPPEPQMRVYTVAGLFAAGIQDHDSSLALGNLADVRAFAPKAVGASGLRLRFAENQPIAARTQRREAPGKQQRLEPGDRAFALRIDAAQRYRHHVAAVHGEGLQVHVWRDAGHAGERGEARSERRVVDGRRRPRVDHARMGGEGQQPVAQFVLEAIHHRQHHDQRGHAQCHAAQRYPGDE